MMHSVMFVSSIVRYGGGERWMIDAAEGLKRKGHRVLLVSRPGSVLHEKARQVNIECRTVEMRGDLDPFAIANLTRLIRSFDPDIVCPNLDREIRLCALSILAAGRLRGAKTLQRGGGIKLIPRRGSEFPLKNKFHYRFFYTRFVHKIIANSRATKETMLSLTPWFPRCKVAVVYNGIDVAVYDRLRNSKTIIKERLRSFLGLANDTTLITLVGELNERKGHRFVIEAADRVLNSHPNVRFLFVGEGDARKEIERMLEERQLHRYYFLLGFRNDISEILTASDILVLPSRVEGFGYVLVEAMAAGIPIVASCASSIPEIVEEGKTGFLHEVGDSAGIADGICRLVADEKLAEAMGEAGFVRVKEQFTLEKMLDQLERVFFLS
ncbi:MAG: glycosyltransferase [Candidatus Latescibacteria bacterium]|nr:glycosyltransferase [Candidatus Latescibacterota bacterium]NIM64518.1 glycosyltransferase [Candidatus Latescibacterota bacterium]NIO00671.1 glycosyltransferase [Candidatus Latescibacterota bacterium]NIO27074.1 glycosyltransferase [Candidatus Latescibacterota bacterium]NIO54598.1 glycosyltransferase [Candidatus Latescibacterota bacterium]